MEQERQRRNTLRDEESGSSGTLKNLYIKVNTFEADEVKILEPIGSGHFGEVFKGNWKGTAVALKKLKVDRMDEGLCTEIQMLR